MESAGEPEDGAEDEAPAQTGEETEEAAEAVGESEEKVSPEEDKKDE